MKNNNILQVAKSTIRPDPSRKDSFIRDYRKKSAVTNTSLAKMCLSQAEYISNLVWISSVVIMLVLSAALFYIIPSESVYVIASLTPFVSCIGVIELYRSEFHKVCELEMVTRVSYSGLLFMRIVCIGTVHLILLLVLAISGSIFAGVDFYKTGILITIPYLLSSILCLNAERIIPSRMRIVSSLAISVLVSGIVLLANYNSFVTLEEYKIVWVLVLALLVVLEIKQLSNTIRKESSYVFEG